MSDNEYAANEAPVAPSEEAEQAPRVRPQPKRFRSRRIALVVGLMLAAGAGLGLLAQQSVGRSVEPVPSVTVTQGDLAVYVTQVGSLWAMQPLEIKSEVEGRCVILEIVEEGTVITQQDVDQGKVLVRLDSSALEDREADENINFLRAEAAYAKAKEDYEIQKKQNESDVAMAELDTKFAQMELERYLSTELANMVLAGQAELTDLGSQPALGGAAAQALRDLSAKVQLAGEELSRAQDTLEWTKKLFDKGYVNRNELMADELLVTRSRIEREAAEQELELFKRYTLPKEAEQRYSDYVEKTRDLDRVKARARSQLSQAEAELKSREASYRLETDLLNKARDMVKKCTIRAVKPGRIIYGSAADPWQRQQTPIREGATIQQNQTILQIPDLATMAVRMNVPEAQVDKLKLGQPAIITLEALPGKVLTGRVRRISPMASSEQAWLNPNAKVYQTDVAVDEWSEDFIPGMSAIAQIIVAQLKGVIRVPIQAVTTFKGSSFCWVKTPDGPVVRPVTVGLSSDKFVEIKDGLHVGEDVYLAPPETGAQEEIEKQLQGREQAEPSGGEAAPEPAGPAQPVAPAGPPASRGAGDSGLGAESAGARPGRPGRPDAPAGPGAEGRAAEPAGPPGGPDQQPQPGAARQGPDLRRFGERMRSAATDEERQKIRQEMMDQMTPEERQQFEERARTRQRGGQGAPGSGRRGQGGQGAGQGGPPAVRNEPGAIGDGA